jgi:hypothetical protein
MFRYIFTLFVVIFIMSQGQAQTAQDSVEIKRAALAYIESQHTPNPSTMEEALHPRMVKRSVFKNKATKKDFVS